MMDRYTGYTDILRDLDNESRHRTLPPHREPDSWIDLCSNDYMGLSSHDRQLSKAYAREFGHLPFSVSASRLLARDQLTHSRLEDYLKDLYGRPALLFNSGYHANTGIVSALNIPGTLFVADKLVHASMIDGLVMGRCKFTRFHHNDMHALEKILEREHGNYDRIVVMTEAIFSMDGDKASLRELAALRDKFPNMLLYVDEAHAFGVRGLHGLGLCEEEGIMDRTDIIMCTLGKAAYSAGAFCVAAPELIDYFINTSRSFIFSTALPPANIAWSYVTISALHDMQEERRHLAEISRRFRSNLNLPDGDTPIVPLLTGSAARAVEMSRVLQEHGILALPIRRPTVPPGGERIRFSLNASLQESRIDKITDIIGSCL